MRQFFTFITLGLAMILAGESPAEAVHGLRETLPGLDTSFSPTHPQESVVQEFHQAVEAFDQHETPAGGDEAGPFKFHSAFSHAVLYDSNISSSPVDPQGELIESPAVSIGVTAGRERISRQFFDNTYELSYIDFAENDKRDHLSHLNATRYGWRGAKLELEVQNEFRPLSPRGTGEHRELRGVGGLATVIATSNHFTFKTAYELSPKLRFMNTWEHEIYDFPADAGSNGPLIELQSRQTHTFRPQLTHLISPKSNVYVNYEFQTADYFRGGALAFKTHAVQAGFLTQLTPKTAFLVQGGYGVHDYNLPALKDDYAPRYRVAVRRELFAKLDLTAYATGSSAPEADESGASAGNVFSNTLGLDLSWDLSLRTTLAAHAAVQFEDRDDRITSTDPETGILSAGVREDTAYSWGVEWKWNRSAVDEYRIGYRYYNKASNFKEFEYQDHQLIGAVGLNLDAIGAGRAR